MERALEKISATSQWVPISWVYWPIDNTRKGIFMHFYFSTYLLITSLTEFILGNNVGVQRNNIEKHKNIASINTYGVTVCWYSGPEKEMKKNDVSFFLKSHVYQVCL